MLVLLKLAVDLQEEEEGVGVMLELLIMAKSKLARERTVSNGR